MPELPEVETMRRGILAAIGSRLVSIEQPVSRYRPIVMAPDLTTMNARLCGRQIIRIDRLGKRVVVVFEGDEHLVLQPKMAGLIALEDVPSSDHIRAIFRLCGGPVSQFVYWDRRGLGTINLWTKEELLSKLDGKVLGPDALAITFDELFHRFGAVSREVKPALLDQRLVAGIGNLYASEILHAARIHPSQRCDRLSRRKWERIYVCMQEILRTAILYEGSTLGDGTYRNALNQSGSYQNVHQVYARAGTNCLSCANTLIVRIVQSQRSTFFCPKCQKKR